MAYLLDANVFIAAKNLNRALRPRLLPGLLGLAGGRQRVAKATHAPVGFFFLAEPPVERVPIPDFRTVANIYMDRPSPDLLDTVYLCQQRGLVPRFRAIHA